MKNIAFCFRVLAAYMSYIMGYVCGYIEGLRELVKGVK